MYLTLSIICWVFPILYFYAFIQGFSFDGIFHLLPIIPAWMSVLFWRQYTRLKSGIQGEKQTGNALRGLPDGYEVFTSVRVSTYDGNAEMDHVIIGDNGIFIVEVKNHKGTIVGSEEDGSWTQHKVGRKGGEYSKQMGNPVKQVRRQVFLLSSYLKQHNIRLWVEGAVFFSNPKTFVDVITDRNPVITTPSELNRYLTSYVPRKKVNPADIEKAKKLLMTS